MSLLKRWRRRRALQSVRIDDPMWQRAVGRLPFLAGLDAGELARLRELATLFLAEKEMHGAAGFEIAPDDRLSIAVQACLPVLELGLAPYDGFVGVIVYPGEFRVRREEVDDDGVVHAWDDALSGEAMPGGPVVLSWEDVGMADAGYNVVIHEFAHKLDMLNGDADGYPLAHAGMEARTWRDTLESAYARFCGQVDRGTETRMDPYGAEHPAEFFAVASEMFFTDPNGLRADFPGLYRQLTLFYRQDPARRLGAGTC